MTKELGSSFTLIPASKDGDNDIIDVVTKNQGVFGTNQTLIDAHQPSYTYDSSNTGVATVGTDGAVTLLAVGDTTITISSAATESYEAATDYTFTLTVSADTTNPSASILPADTGVPQNTASLVFTFSEEIDITQGGTVTMSPNKIAGTPDYTSSALWSSDKTVLTIPLDALEYSETYTVDVSSFKDLADNPMDPVSGHNFTIAAKPASGSSRGGSSGTTTTTDTQQTIEINGVDIDCSISNGVVTLKPTDAQITQLLKSIGADGLLRITVSGIDGMKSAIIEIDLSKLTTADRLQIFTFSVLDMEINFPAGALASMQKLAKTLRFGLKPGSLIFELTNTSDKAIDWYDYKNPVTVSMAYTPAQDIFPQQVVMLREDGSLVPRSWYAEGRVYAKVHQPGTYDVTIKSLDSFSDTAGLWMDEAVGYMAARGIIEGVGDNLFDHSGTVTKAHFLTMLMRALDVEAKADGGDLLPADYASAPEWAQSHIDTAAALDITLSDEEGNFNPNAAIIRQEMFFMAYEAMGACGMLPDMFTGQWISFSDWDGKVRVEYSDAIQNLYKLGLVNGNGDGTLNPGGTSTRAEGAQFLYNILKYDAK